MRINRIIKMHERQCQWSRRRLIYASLIMLLVGGTALVVMYKVISSPLFNQYGILRETIASAERREQREQKSTRTILLWSSFFGDPRWSLSSDTLGPQQFRDELHCPVHHCELTNQHDFLPGLDMYDAIVFHGAEPFPVFRPRPAVRHPHQSYVFALMEPPGETKHWLHDEQNFYNLTMTYRLDSDIIWPYMELVDRETEAIVSPKRWPNWRKPPPVAFPDSNSNSDSDSPSYYNDSSIWELFPRKSKMAAWFVSHCETLSRREQFVASLQQHITIDVYGKCGPLKCPRNSKQCDDMLDTDYMFYMALENSLCEDYVTEKLLVALERNIIPVVFGGADYSRFLPPHSYIDAQQFESVELLADHLRFVASDINEYMRYFWWRRHYRLHHSSPFCALCAQLHGAGAMYKTQYYEDIEAWWLNSCRFNATIQF